MTEADPSLRREALRIIDLIVSVDSFRDMVRSLMAFAAGKGDGEEEEGGNEKNVAASWRDDFIGTVLRVRGSTTTVFEIMNVSLSRCFNPDSNALVILVFIHFGSPHLIYIVFF